ncbi:hypothetical protein M9H77_28050 [Catharanthus roseus]|uniref:Uncharacterized protein n=1 Tax=Catharanthus roseus TaxID=4058 RepID=A0ACC0AFP1_CATRO|nr:hypothetical protein M9H77_28050 [Catharanthus roseus]
MVSGYHVSLHRQSSKLWYSYGWIPACWGRQTITELDDMATGVIQGHPSSPTHIVSFTKKVQTIIRMCIILLAVPWVALHLNMIFNRHFQCKHRHHLRSPYWTMVPWS